MSITALSPFTPTSGQPVPFLVSGLVALQVNNPTNYSLSLLYGKNRTGIVPPGQNVLYTGLANITDPIAWILLTPTLAANLPAPNSPVLPLASPSVQVTTYTSAGDTLPTGCTPGSFLPTDQAYDVSKIPLALGGPYYYSVRAFGAQGDGATDDTTAISAAIQAAFTPQIADPTTAPTATGNTGAGSTFTGGQTVNVAYSFLHYLGETNLSPSTQVTMTNAANLVITAPAFPAPQSRYYGVNIFISVSNGSTTLIKGEAGIIPSSTTAGGTNVTYTGFPVATNNPSPLENTTGGGIVYFPPGVYLTGPQSLHPHVSLLGAGWDISTIRLKNAANADLLSYNVGAINQAGTNLLGSTRAAYSFYIRDLTLDGNQWNQTSGPSWCIRAYCYGYTFENLHVMNGYYGGIQVDYYGPEPQQWSSAGATPGENNYISETTWKNVRVTLIRNAPAGFGIGIEMFGPHDSQWSHVIAAETISHGIHIGPNCNGLQATHCHAYATGINDVNSVSWLQEAIALYATGCEAEGSPNLMLAILAGRCNWVGGSIYGGSTGAQAGAGVQIGQPAGGTPFTNSAFQSAGARTAQAVTDWQIISRIENITSATGCINFSNDGGFGFCIAGLLAHAGTSTIYSGSPAASTALYMTADGFTTDTRQQIQLNKGIQAWGQSASAPATGTGGTIATGTDLVSRVSPAGAVTGVILASGTFSGQVCIVINEAVAANTITMAASGTSHVADGVSCVIAGLTQKQFIWDSSTALWYHS